MKCSKCKTNVITNNSYLKQCHICLEKQREAYKLRIEKIEKFNKDNYGKKRMCTHCCSVYDFCVFKRCEKCRERERNRNKEKVIKLRNHNKFLWRTGNDLIGKTGYTRAAKHCFLGSFSKSGKQLIVAIQGSRKPWDDLEYLINKNY